MHTKATRRKIAESMKGNHNSLGKKRPAAAVKATADAIRGIPRSAAIRKKISRNRKGKMVGSQHPNWKGGRTIEKSGYALILVKGHHRSVGNGYVREHIVVAEKMLGRRLKKWEIVHHKNGKKADNRPSNLEVMSKKRHDKLTIAERLRRKDGTLL